MKNNYILILLILLLPVTAMADRTRTPITADNGIIACDTCVTESGSQTITDKTINEPLLTLKQSETPSPTSEGEIWWDTDNDELKIGSGGSTITIGSGGGSGGGASILDDLGDVNVSSPSSGEILVYDGSNSFDNKSISGDITIDSEGVSEIQNNSVELATDTTGNYVSGATGGTGISISGTPAEG